VKQGAMISPPTEIIRDLFFSERHVRSDSDDDVNL
jgi:hypothetical protein